MGAWGYGIKQDDVVCDVVVALEDQLKQGTSVPDATRAVLGQFANALEDCDDGPLVWIELAVAQWTYGQLDGAVLQHVQDDLTSGRSLSRWNEDERGLSKRKVVLENFVNKIQSPNPRPKKAPKVVIRKPKFRPGDCLSVQLPNDQFGAAIVIAIDHSNPEYGNDFVGLLDYMSPTKPSLDVFLKKQWLRRTHHSWQNEIDVAWYMYVGFQKMKQRLEVIGQVELSETDPKVRHEGIAFASWVQLGQQIIFQRDWDKK